MLQRVDRRRRDADAGGVSDTTAVSVLTDLDAFFLEHRECGDLRMSIDDCGDSTVVRCECACSAVFARRPVAPRKSLEDTQH